MATGRSVGGNNKEYCSICLEPFRGRHPKFLDCFHSYCVLCLKRLEDKERAQRTQTSGDLGFSAPRGVGSPPLSITCPSCRRKTIIPPAGVTSLQSNFYLDGCEDEDAATTTTTMTTATTTTTEGVGEGSVTCTLCLDEHAVFQCRRCQESFCNYCRNYHNTVCACRQFTIQDPPCSLTSSVQGASTPVSTSGASPVSTSAGSQTTATSPPSLPSSSSSLLLPPPQSSSSSSSSSSSLLLPPPQPPPPSSSGPHSREWGDLCGRLEMLASQVSVLQSSHLQLSQQVWAINNNSSNSSSKASSCLSQTQERALQQRATSLENTNSLLQHQQGSLQQRVSCLEDSNRVLQGQQSELQQEVRSLKDKNSILHQDLAVMAADKDDMRNQVAQLQADQRSLTADISNVQGDVVSMKTDISNVQGDVVSMKTDISNVQGDVVSMKTEIDNLKTDITAIKTDCTSINTDFTKVKADLANVESGMASLKKDNSNLQSDVKTSKDEVVSLGRRVQSCQDSLQDKVKKLSTLETQLVKANKQVSFHALLDNDVISDHTKQTLICSGVITNVGGGYSGQTGVFTAPVSGLYSFMTTTSSCKNDCSIKAALRIVVDDDTVIAFVMSQGYSWSTTHTTVKLTAGQRVWLRTGDARKYMYGCWWWTSFTGMLLQADL